jgi:hypothetical protein
VLAREFTQGNTGMRLASDQEEEWRDTHREPRLPGAARRLPRCRRRRGMTLLEIAIAAVCGVLVISAAVCAAVVMSGGAMVSAQHTSAMGLCEERLEQVRADPDFAGIAASRYPVETNIPLTHTESPSNQIIPCTRQASFQDVSLPGIPGKRVIVLVTWTFRHWAQQERIEGIVYDFD